MKKQNLSVGILGCGVGAALHLLGLESIEDVEIIWFCDKNEEQAKNLMKLWGKDAKVASDIDDLLRSEQPDIVHICTPQDTHAEMTLKAFDAGCHVLLEKPMALTVAECERIISARDKSGCQLCIMHNHMFDPIIQKMHRRTSRGDFGKLVFGEVRHFYSVRKMVKEGINDTSHWARSLKGGIASEFLPHSIYLIQSFFGPARELQLIHRCITGDKNAGLNLQSWAVQISFESATARLLAIAGISYGHFSIDLYGMQAAAHINMMDLTYSIERVRGFLPLTLARMESSVEQSLCRLRQVTSNTANIAIGRLKRRLGHRNLIRAFYKTIREGNVSPVTGEDGLAVVRTLEMFDEAMENIQHHE